MSKIDLPHYHRLVSKHEGRFATNTYSGSMGTLPDQGCVSARTFNYRVYVDISSGKECTFLLIAESYIIRPWHLGGNKTDYERSEFEASEKGVEDASQWLVQISTKYGF